MNSGVRGTENNWITGEERSTSGSSWDELKYLIVEVN